MKAYLFGYSSQSLFWGIVLDIACKLGISSLISIATRKTISVIGYPRMGLIDSIWLIWPIIFKQ